MVSVGSVEVNSMMKSTKSCPLIVVLGLYLMSNSLSSIAHFTNLPEDSSLCNMLHWVFYRNLNGVGLEVWSKSYGGGHQC